MTRLPLSLAGLSFALMATIASAQSYPQSMYGPGPMQPSPYGYGAMQAGGMYPAPPSGMSPAAMYAAAGYPAPAPVGYGPSAMPQGMYAPSAQAPAQQQSPMPQQLVPGAEYHGPQGGVAKANPPPAKLPPGVKAENGLLFYNGSPTAPSPDINYQQFPMKRPGSPIQMASYQAGDNSGAPNSVMSSSNSMQAGQQAQANGQCQNCNGNCDGNCDDGCCGWLGSPYKCLFSFCHGGMFPGKVGYVWQAGYDNLAMTRNAGTDRRLLVFDTGGTAFNAENFDFNWDYGGKAHIELIGPSGITYQWAYTRIATFVTNESVLGLADLSVPGNGNVVTQPGFALADAANFYYSSAIQTGEFNVIFPFGSFEIITGYRYMQVDERSKITMFTEFNPPASFTANSLNVMNGGQIGGMGRWEMFGLFDFDFDAKFAVMGDAARIQQEATDNAGNPIGPATGTKTRVAFVTELGAQLVLPIGASWSAHCGYNVYFIDRVALAPDQFDFNLGGDAAAGTLVNNHGDIVLQGVNLGVTAVW